MNKVTEEEIKYDIDKTPQISQFVNCVHKLQLVTLAQLWGLEEQIKMEGSFIGVDQKAPPLLLVCSYSRSCGICSCYKESHLAFLAV